MVFEHFPYTNFHDINLDWILRTLREMEAELQDFVFMNTIKYADPIQWDITTQYAKNTIVIDPATGDAYISTRPVPAGVLLSNTDYWSVIFNYQAVVNNIKENIAYDVGDSSTTPVALQEHDLVWWHDGIYMVLYDIPAGTALIPGTNVQKYTVDEKFRLFEINMEGIAGALTQEIQDREDADTALGDRIDQEIQDRQDDVQALEDADTALGGRIDQEILDRQSEDQRIIELIQETSLFINVKEYGAVGDGVADDTLALIAAFAAAEDKRSTIWFPDGVYIITSRIRVYSNTHVLFDSDASLQLRRVTSGSFGPALCFGEYGNENFAESYEGTHDVIIENMKFNGGFDVTVCVRTDTHGGGTIAIGACKNITIRNCVFENCYNDHYLDIAGSDNVHVENCRFTGGGYVGVDYSYEAINTDFMTAGGFPHYGVHDNKPSKNLWITECYFENFYGSSYAIGNHSQADVSGFLSNINIISNRFVTMSKCIRMFSARYIRINDNMFSDVGRATEDSYAHPIRIFDCARIKINGNMFINVSTIEPIYIQKYTGSWNYDLEVSDNSFSSIGDSNNSRSAMQIADARLINICNNMFQSVTGRPITIQNCSRGIVADNSGYQIGTSLETVTAINLLDSCQYLTVTDNMFPDCPGDAVRVGSASSCIRRNNLQTSFTAF